MKDNRGSVQLKLTEDQKEEIRKATGKTMETIQLDIAELEERIAPIKIRF